MRRILALILALVMTMALVACGGDKPSSTPTSTPGTSTPATSTPANPDKPSEPAVDPEAARYGGEFIMCSNNATSTMDVHEGGSSLGNNRWMIHIYESVATTNVAGTVYPEVCDYEESADGLTIKLSLRDGVTFSNGKKVTMDDVWASLCRYAGSATTSNYDKLWKGTGIQKDDKSITFTFEKYNVNFASSIRGLSYAIMPKEICDKYPVTGGELQANGMIRGGKIETQINEVADVIGTGPYKLESYSEENVVLVRNDNYVPYTRDAAADGRAAPKKAYADKITIAINRNADSRSAAVIAGEYDMGMVTAAMMPAAVAAGYQKLDQGSTWTHGMFFNLDASNADSPIANVNVRKAIRACLDMNAVLLALSGELEANVLEPYPIETGNAAYYNTIIADGEWNIADKELAKEYLQKANYNGEAIVWLLPANNNMYTVAMGAIPQMEAVGIKVEMMVVDSGSHTNLRKDPKTGHDIGSWNVQKRDDNPVLHSTFVTGTQGWWSSDARTAAIDKMKAAPTGSAASVEGYKEWCQAVVDECPFILFGHLINYDFVKPDIVWDVQGSTEYYWNVYRK